MTPQENLAQQAARVRAAVQSIGRFDLVMVRPEDVALLVRTEWTIGGQTVAVQQTYHLSDLTGLSSGDLVLSLRRWGDKADTHLATKATGVIVRRARELGVTLGQLLQEVGV